MRLPALFRFLLLFALLLWGGTLGQEHKAPDQELLPVKIDGKWGYIDTSGKLRIAAQYSDVEDVGELSVDLAAVAADDLWGFIDYKGNWVVEPRFHLAENCVSGFMAVEMDDGRWQFINRDGDLVDGTGYDRVQCFVDGPPAVISEGDHEWTYLDVRRSRLLPVRQNIPEGFDEGLTPMKASGIWGFVDESGAFLIRPKFDEARGFSEGLAAVRLGDKWGYADKSGAIVIPPQFGWAYGFAEGMGGVKFESKYGFINHQGKFVIAPSFQDVREFSEGLAAVEKGSKWGYIDKEGNVVVEPRFENNALPFRGGIAQVRLRGGEIGYINKSGEYVWKPTL